MEPDTAGKHDPFGTASRLAFQREQRVFRDLFQLDRLLDARSLMFLRLRHWQEHLVRQEALSTPARGAFAWAITTTFVVGLLALCALFPPVAARTQLPLLPAALSFAPLPLLSGVDALLRRARLDLASRAISFAGNFLVEAFPAVLIGLSASAGAALFAAFFLLTALFHSQLFRISPRYPFWLLCFVAQAALSLAINADADHVAVWTLLLPATMVSALVVGNVKLHEDRRRDEAFSARIALGAQLLESEAKRGEELEARIEDLLGIAHDIKSPLTAASLDLASLERQLATLGHDDLLASAGGVRASITRLKELFEATRERTLELQVKLEAVPLKPCVDAVVSRCRRRFSAVSIIDRVPRELTVLAVIGQQTVERILENVLHNACEGDGERAARNVVVEATARDGIVVVKVTDDGPGFSAPQLAEPIQSYATTKSAGTGLGLFTVERLVRASGGRLTLANGASGGATVTAAFRAR
jgi:signal transduction histidine kinase